MTWNQVITPGAIGGRPKSFLSSKASIARSRSDEPVVHWYRPPRCTRRRSSATTHTTIRRLLT